MAALLRHVNCHNYYYYLLLLFMLQSKFISILLCVFVGRRLDAEKLDKGVRWMIGRQSLTGSGGRVNGSHVGEDTLDEEDSAAEQDLLPQDVLPRRIHARQGF